MYSPPSYQRVPATSIDIPLEDRYAKTRPGQEDSTLRLQQDAEGSKGLLRPTRYTYKPERPINGNTQSVLGEPATTIEVSRSWSSGISVRYTTQTDQIGLFGKGRAGFC